MGDDGGMIEEVESAREVSVSAVVDGLPVDLFLLPETDY